RHAGSAESPPATRARCLRVVGETAVHDLDSLARILMRVELHDSRAYSRTAGSMVVAASRGHRGMPEVFRTSRGWAHPWQRGILAGSGVVAVAPAGAEEAPVVALHEIVVGASRSIDRHEIVTLVLILGLLFFAVVTAVLLLRTLARAARQGAAADEKITTLR